MKFTGLLIIFNSVLNLINIVNSQPSTSYKESINVSMPKEYINIHNPPHSPSPISITIPTLIPPQPFTPYSNYHPPSLHLNSNPSHVPPPSPQIININDNGSPSPPINSIYLTPTCQNML